MSKANSVLGALSLVVGGGLLSLALGKGGFSPTLGLFFGILLMANGIARLWLARGAKRSRDLR